MIPYSIFLPEYNELFLFFLTSKLTADCIVDLLENWWQTVKHRFSHIQKLVINQDNGPENNSRRTQFMKRILDFATSSQLTLGVTLNKLAMAEIETQINRLPNLQKWFVEIFAKPT